MPRGSNRKQLITLSNFLLADDRLIWLLHFAPQRKGPATDCGGEFCDSRYWISLVLTSGAETKEQCWWPPTPLFHICPISLIFAVSLHRFKGVGLTEKNFVVEPRTKLQWACKQKQASKTVVWILAYLLKKSPGNLLPWRHNSEPLWCAIKQNISRELTACRLAGAYSLFWALYLYGLFS